MSHHRNYGIPSRHEFAVRPVYRPALMALVACGVLWAIIVMVWMMVTHG